MEYLVALMAILFSFTFTLAPNNLRRFLSSGYAIGLVAVSVIALVDTGHFEHVDLVSIIWVVIYQLTWVVFRDVPLGLSGQRLWNTALAGLSLATLLGGEYELHIASPRGLLLVVAVLLGLRWLCLLEVQINKSNTETVTFDHLEAGLLRSKMRFAHRAALFLSRHLERYSLWFDLYLLPPLLRPLTRAAVVLILTGIMFIGSWSAMHGLMIVPAGDVALVRDFRGDFSDQLLSPGLRAVWPYSQQLVLVSTTNFKVPEKGALEVVGKTSDGFDVSASISATVRVKVNSKSIVRLLNGIYRGDQRQAAEETVRLVIARYIAKNPLSSFLPIFGKKIESISHDVLELARTDTRAIFHFDSIHVESFVPI